MSEQTNPSKLAQQVNDLVTLPEVYLKLQEILNDPDYQLEDITDAVSVDPGLTSRILRVANSAFFGFPSKIEKISHAVSLMGTQHIHDFVLATSVLRSFAGLPRELVDMRKFWHGSVLCGAAAKLLADRQDFIDSEHMFTAGLLAHIGRLVLYLHLPADIGEAHAVAKQTHAPLSQALQTRLGFSDVEVAGELFSVWQLPGSLIDPVRHSASPLDRHSEPYFEKACIVHVASAIADMDNFLLKLEDVVDGIDSAAWRILELDPNALRDLIAAADSLADEIAGQYLPEPA